MNSTRNVGWFVTAALGLGAAMSSAAIAAEEEAAGLQEVTVTANRRDEPNQRVPLEIVALSADKGEKLWSAKLVPGFANPATYMIDGKQYVTVLAGRAGKARMYTFVLDGSVPIPAPPKTPPPPAFPTGQ